jgi:hypothetical protein
MTYWYWGHPSGRSNETIAIGFHRKDLEPYWGGVELAATFHAPDGVHNKENGAHIWICRDQRVDWAMLWPHARRT